MLLVLLRLFEKRIYGQLYKYLERRGFQTADQSTMSAESLGTFPVICAIDEVQNSLPLKTMLFKRHMTSIIGISDTFPNS